MGTKHALKDVKIKDANIPRISMCGGGCGQGYCVSFAIQRTIKCSCYFGTVGQCK